MPVIAPNTPRTSWIRDSGTILVTTTDVFIDELGNFFIDEFGNNLLDSVSTDRNDNAQSWIKIVENQTSWADAFAMITVFYLITEVSNQRTTVQGDTRISKTSDNKKKTTVWSEDEY